MKKKFIIIPTLLLLALLTACGGTNNSDSPENSSTLKLGVTQNEENAEYKAIEQFKEKVEERTNGEVEVETYSSDQLASVPDLLEQASVGSNVGTVSDAAMLSDLKEEFAILQAPYMFDDYDEIDKFLESELYQEWVEEFNEQGIQVLSFNFQLGERNLATTDKVTSPEELEGNVIRTSGANIVDKTISAMGGSTSGMPWTEAYPGLEQGVIDGVEAHSVAIHEASMEEVLEHVAETNHYQLSSSLVVSSDWFNDLPSDTQDIVLEEAEEAGEKATKLTDEETDEAEQSMKDAGVEFHEVDRNEFQSLTEEVYEETGLETTRKEVSEVLKK